MPRTTQIPERVSQCRGYLDNSRLSVTGTLTLPNFSRPTQDMTGAGISGTVSTPTRGSLESLRASFDARVMTPELLAAFTYEMHTLEFRAIIQSTNMGGAATQRFSAFMKAIPVSVTSGTIQNGEEMGASIELEVLAVTITIDEQVYAQVDKLNGIVAFADANGVLVDENAAAAAFLQ